MLDRAIRVNPNSPKAYVGKGMNLIEPKISDYEQTERLLLKALELDTRSDPLFQGLSILEEKRKNYLNRWITWKSKCDLLLLFRHIKETRGYLECQVAILK